MRDLHNNIKCSRGESPAAITAGDATLTTEIIDVQGFDSLEFVWISGAITDSTFTITMYEGDASNMSDETPVADADLLGVEPVFIYNDGGDDAVKKVGYRGSKRYVRCKAVQTGATTGGYLCCVVLQGHPGNAPVA